MTYLLVLTKSIESGSALVATLSSCLVVYVPPSPQCVFPSWVWIMHFATRVVVTSLRVKDKTLIVSVFEISYCGIVVLEGQKQEEM